MNDAPDVNAAVFEFKVGNDVTLVYVPQRCSPVVASQLIHTIMKIRESHFDPCELASILIGNYWQNIHRCCYKIVKENMRARLFFKYQEIDIRPAWWYLFECKDADGQSDISAVVSSIYDLISVNNVSSAVIFKGSLQGFYNQEFPLG